LHQHQREHVQRKANGRPETCVVAALDDVRLANRLASQALSARLDALSPQGRALLEELDEYVGRRAEEEAAARSEIRFTQRRLREELGWSDRALRRQLRRLAELEYVVVYRTGRGNQRAYQLLYEGQSASGPGLLLGLADVSRLEPSAASGQAESPKRGVNRRPKKANRRPAGAQPAANRRPRKTTQSPSGTRA
jgi:hypothetical protein